METSRPIDESDHPGARPIGKAGEEALALAFAGGTFDTAMQLGVVHALITIDGRPPDAVVGISAGAINAAALAEILQAGTGLPAEERKAEQVRRFRQFLEEYLQIPAEILRALLPDPYEVKADAPLEPLDLPIHFRQERDDRREATLAKAGLTHLLNDVLALRLRVSFFARALHHGLSLRAAAEIRRPLRRWWTRLRRGAGLVRQVLVNIWPLTPLIGMLAWLPRSTPLGRRGVSVDEMLRRSWLRRSWRWLLRRGFDVLTTAILLAMAPPLAVWFLLRRWWPRRDETSGKPGYRYLLEHYQLADALADNYVLRRMLVRLFDRHYYGAPDMGKILRRALSESSAEDLRPRPRPLSEYRRGKAPVYVAPVAADAVSGRLRLIPQRTSVVDALLAAGAAVPVFPACTLPDGEGGKMVLIDGINVANEPTSALVELLREHLDPASAGVRMFPVSSLPVSEPRLSGPQDHEYLGVAEVAPRVLQLQRFRDASLERQLTELYSRLLPYEIDGRKMALHRMPAAADQPERTFVRARIQPIEPEQPLNLNQALLGARDEADRRRLVLETVADGCRATLETMIRSHIAAVLGENGKAVSCAAAVRRHLDLAPEPPPPGEGPGLPEVCRACALHRGGDNALGQVLSLRSWGKTPPPEAGWSWPRWGERAEPVAETPRQHEPDVAHAASEGPDGAGPWVSLLLSGGVFRGVLQIGTLNGLSEAGVAPRLIAGASVGSITGAMAAALFRVEGEERWRKMALVCAIFLTLDRLVITDRFTDAVRTLALRAAVSDFSLRDLDLLLRRYDAGSGDAFSRRTRRAVAGLERLFYLSPFELLQWLRAVRENDVREIYRLFREDLQELLDRLGVGQEILGSEPLALLIDQHVLAEEARPENASFDWFRQQGGSAVDLLAVVTNLTLGQLETVPGGPRQGGDALLRNTLLASAAFPAVFRPRWSWEMFKQATTRCQYVDGGVMDNLPLDAVVHFLHEAARRGEVSRRPRVGGVAVPHLLLSASLEPLVEEPSPGEIRRAAGDWVALLRRARQLSYNRKIDNFATAQRHFRQIYERFGSQDGFVPLDTEVVTFKPRCLTGTFAFHPMLGFRRERQAAAIAHGCATALATLWALSRRRHTRAWAEAWGVRLEDFDETTAELPEDSPDPAHPPSLRPAPSSARRAGGCWFRTEALCPFSAAKLQQLAGKKSLSEAVEHLAQRHDLPAELLTELPRLYEACGRASTHRP